MKLLSLKQTLYPVIMLVGFASVVNINAENNHPQHAAHDEAAKAYAQLENLLYTCIFDQTSSKPFSYFVFEVTELVNQHKGALGTRIPVQVLEHLVQDLHKALQITRSAVQPEKSALKVGMIFQKYHKFLPPTLKNKKVPQFLAGLRFRLKQV